MSFSKNKKIILIGVVVIILGFGFFQYFYQGLSSNEGKDNLKLEKDRLDQSLKKGVNWLKLQQNEDGSITLNNDTRFNIWETANSLMAWTYAREYIDDNVIKKAQDFLIKSRSPHNSFFHTTDVDTSKIENHCIETTSAALIALNSTAYDIYTIEKIKNFILATQTQEGYWEIGTPFITKQRNFPSVTGYALMVLGILNKKGENINKGLEYLIKTQKDEGDWGTSEFFYDTSYYATYVNVVSLVSYNKADSDTVKKAIEFVKKNQNEDGSWEYSKEGFPSKELRTALALNTLLVSNEPITSPSIQKGIDWLLDNQKEDGRWLGGYFNETLRETKGKKEDILATAQALIAISRYKTKLQAATSN